jgi:hypothetical protein
VDLNKSQKSNPFPEGTRVFGIASLEVGKVAFVSVIAALWGGLHWIFFWMKSGPLWFLLGFGKFVDFLRCSWSNKTFLRFVEFQASSDFPLFPRNLFLMI